jgi:hypothetical protein
MAVKNFSRHMPNSHNMPSSWGKKDKGAHMGDRTMGAAGDAMTGAGAGAAIGSVVPVIGTGLGALVGGGLGAIKGFFSTPKGGGAKKLIEGAEAGARSLAAHKKLGGKAEGSVGKVKKDSKDEFLKKGERVTKAQVQPSGEFEGY